MADTNSEISRSCDPILNYCLELDSGGSRTASTVNTARSELAYHMKRQSNHGRHGRRKREYGEIGKYAVIYCFPFVIGQLLSVQDRYHVNSGVLQQRRDVPAANRQRFDGAGRGPRSTATMKPPPVSFHARTAPPWRRVALGRRLGPRPSVRAPARRHRGRPERRRRRVDQPPPRSGRGAQGADRHPRQDRRGLQARSGDRRTWLILGVCHAPTWTSTTKPARQS